MNESAHILCNGALVIKGKAILTTANRAFKYGDSLFETVHCKGSRLLFFKDHYQRLIRGMLALKMDIHSIPTREQFEEKIAHMLVKNKYFTESRLRLCIYRKDGGLYTPLTNQVSWIAESEPLAFKGYAFNEKGLIIDVYSDMLKQSSILSPYKIGSAVMFVLAGIFKKENNLSDCLIKNQDGKIIEGLSSNLFWVKDNQVFTPIISSGCVEGVMRKNVIELIKNMGVVLHETLGATESQLLDADEVFLTNAIQGIQWVVGFREQRYFNFLTKRIANELSKQIN